MKYFWIFCLVLPIVTLSLQKAYGQSDTLHLYQAYTSFSNSEKAEWTAFENNWNYVDYTELKQTNKIKKLNCSNCESFYADIYLEINDTGKVTSAIFKSGKICGIPISNSTIIQAFENSIKKQTFNYLKNKSFIARFGHILKC